MNANWTIRIERLQIHLPVGVYADEIEPQPLWVSLAASGEASAAPGSLAQCFDYAPLCHWLTHVWPKTPHTPLLETRINELLSFVFALDARVRTVWVGLYKQRVSPFAVAIGIERSATRAEIESDLCASSADVRLAAPHFGTREGEPHATLKW
jgi:dihydroneopterin aldolase